LNNVYDKQQVALDADNSLTLNDYQEATSDTAIYPGKGTLQGVIYTTLGLCGEAGEIAGKVKKIMRDSNGKVSPEIEAAIQKEVGDVMWYVGALAKELNATLSRIAQDNLDKLADRKARGVLGGSGDNR
jgi:NTP pyrophosphatase (non-canonical NTP hydrolase)